jgi:hypothetical protein
VLDPEGDYQVIRGELAAVTDELPDNAGGLGTLPAASLENIEEFCRQLTGNERALLAEELGDEQWRYELPDIADWRAGAQSPEFEIPTIQDPLNGSTVNLRELVTSEGGHFESEKDPSRRLFPVRGGSLRYGRSDLGFRVVVRRSATTP